MVHAVQGYSTMSYVHVVKLTIFFSWTHLKNGSEKDGNFFRSAAKSYHAFFFFNVFLYFLRDTEKKTACPIRDAFLFFLNF